MSSPLDLERFRRRVRLVRAWQGLALGAVVGAVASLGLAVLDFLNVRLTEPVWLIGTAVVAAVIGAVIGYFRPVPKRALADSIDRRAGLENRVATAEEVPNSGLGQALRQDAADRLGAVRPAAIYPLQVNRRHGAAIALGVATAAVFLLGNTPILLNDRQKAAREAVQEQAKTVERIRREYLENPKDGEASDAEKKLAAELRRLEKDLERGRMTPEELLKRREELTRQAETLTKNAVERAERNLETAAEAWKKREAEALKAAGLEKADADLARLSEAELNQRRQAAESRLAQAQAKISELQRQMNEIDRQLANPNLSDAERKALEEQRKALEQEQAKAAESRQAALKDIESLELSQEAKEVLNKLANHPLYKEIQELQRKMQQNAEAAKRTGQPALTPEERRELQEQLEQLARRLADDVEMEEYLKAMLEALKEGKSMCNSAGLCVGLGLGSPGTGPGGADEMPFDTGMINKLQEGVEGKGQTRATMTRGQVRPNGEPTAYVETRGPTYVGTESAVPFARVSPSERRKAESALQRSQIPARHEKRVKEYFESLGN
jgi:chemotaxis protein histidine kinase CheA